MLTLENYIRADNHVASSIPCNFLIYFGRGKVIKRHNGVIKLKVNQYSAIMSNNVSCPVTLAHLK